MGKIKLLLICLGLVALVTVVLKLPKPAVKTPPLNSVSEMTEILGSDQNTRIAGGRKLVERVGVEQALEILNNSALPHTGEGHLVVHQVGFYAYRKYGLDSILHCKDYFLFACYHGAIIEAASKEGFPAIAKMVERCKDSPLRYFQCLHAAGHAILAIWNYDLPQALKTCDELFGNLSEEELGSCHNGAFMENLFGVHDWGTGKEVKRDWLSNDPYFPCNAFGEKYQRGCWLNQAARIYQMYGGDLVRTTEACNNVGVDKYRDWCLDNVARQIHAMTNNDVSKVFALCQTMGDWRDNCDVVNAGSYYSVGGRRESVDVCRLVLPDVKEKCYKAIVGQLVYDQISPGDKINLCQTMEGPFNQGCYQAVTSSL